MRSRRTAVVAFAVAMAPGCSVVGEVVRRPLHGVDLNTASVEELAKLPGLSETDAARIVAHRPYQIEGDLVSWGIVGQQQLESFEPRTYVGRASRAGEAVSCATMTSSEPPPPEPSAEPPEDDDEP